MSVYLNLRYMKMTRTDFVTAIGHSEFIGETAQILKKLAGGLMATVLPPFI
jgi:hypothetical protein